MDMVLILDRLKIPNADRGSCAQSDATYNQMVAAWVGPSTPPTLVQVQAAWDAIILENPELVLTGIEQMKALDRKQAIIGMTSSSPDAVRERAESLYNYQAHKEMRNAFNNLLDLLVTKGTITAAQATARKLTVPTRAEAKDAVKNLIINDDVNA